MNSEVAIQYSVIFGKGDASEWMDWSVLLTKEELCIYKDAVKNKIPLNSIDELCEAKLRAYREIEQQEIKNALEYKDEYVIECQENGYSPFDIGWILKIEFIDPNEEE